MTRRSLFAAFFTFLWIASASPRSRDLTLLERIEAQRAIDRIYYQHQVGATEPFDQAVPTSVLDRKVRTYLKQSAALETFWRTPIDAKALQAEWKRIARESRFPDRLKEVHDALGSDPILMLTGPAPAQAKPPPPE